MSLVPPEAFEGLTGRLVSLGLIHAVWVGLLASAVVAIVFQALPRLSHRVRHGLLAMAMGTVVAGPIVVVLIQRSIVAPSPPTGGVSIRVATIWMSEEPATAVAASGQPPTSKLSMSIGGSLRFSQILTVISNRLKALQPFVLAAWLIGVVTLSARLILGAISLRRLVRSATPLGDPIQPRADDLARRLKLRRTPSVMVHPGPTEPGLCGLIHPKILLPGPWLAGADAGRIDAILAHELAHARRLDLPANLLQRLVETALFFHPAVHGLSRSLRRERELCADALAVALTGDPIALASALESVARFRLTSRSSGRRASLFGASLGGENLSLLPRIQELLGMMPNTPARRSLWPWVSLPVAALFALLGASLGLAQDPPETAESSAPNISVQLTSGTVPLQAPSGKNAGEAKPYQDNSKPLTDNQISLEVRFLSVEDPAWRGPIKDGMREVHHDHAFTAWVLQDATVRDLLTRMQQHPTSNILRAPKVTTFEGARATIISPPENNLVAELQKSGAASAQGFHHITKPIELGSQVDLVGKIRPGSVMLTVDLFHTALIPAQEGKAQTSHKSSEKLAAGSKRENGDDRVPGFFTRHVHVVEDVPKEASLLISLGHREERRESTNTHRNPAVAERMILEGLVMITPRPIIL